MNATVDLAIILIVAGITCLIFKKLKQPLVLGYIVAGFLTGPHFPYFMTVSEEEVVKNLAEVGVIMLMFSIGLEFSFYKLKKVGVTAFIATAVAVTGMVLLGFTAGIALGFTSIESLFLGCMLSMSSTAIIFKAFEDMGLKEQKFANLVLGVLILEDIVGIVMMVMLTGVANAVTEVSPVQLAMSLGKLVFCLVLWFVVGMYLIPTLFKRYADLFNDETLVVFTMGLCLSMVIIAEYAELSSALGAFIMGSLIAESPQSERIEQLIQPIKNLYSAVFFVSVGMLVDPVLLVQYAGPIAILILLTIVGQITCGTLGMLAAGQSLENSFRSGFCLCQIGEFSFILAALGIAFEAIQPFLYPVIVAVSVFTTFTTPFFIGKAYPVYQWFGKHLPPKLLRAISAHTQAEEEEQESEWTPLLRAYTIRMLIFSVLTTALCTAGELYIIPYLTNTIHLAHANWLIAAIMFILIAPCFGLLLRNNAYDKLLRMLWYKRRANHFPLLALEAGKLFAFSVTLYTIFHILADLPILPSLVLSIIAIYFVMTSRWLRGIYLRLESSFMVNLNEKHVLENSKGVTTNVTEQLDKQLYICSYNVDAGSPFLGKSLKELSFHRKYLCDIVRIGTKSSVTYMPGGNVVIEPGSRFTIIGTQNALLVYARANKQERLHTSLRFEPVTLQEYMLDTTIPRNYQLFIYALPVKCAPALIGKSIRNSQIREHWNCMVIGLERRGYNTVNPDINAILEADDLLWIIGRPDFIKQMCYELNLE